MANVVVLGAGISGHNSALLLKKKLGKKHTVIMVSPNTNYQWIPSNIWVGIGQMSKKNVSFPLAPVYKRKKIEYKQALATAIHPDGDAGDHKPYVKIKYVTDDKKDQEEKVYYDFLLNATGPKLNFAATPGLGPDKFSNSVCTYEHAAESWKNLQVSLDKMANGEKQTFLVGTGHPMATCQGAAFEYVLNIAFEVYKRKLQDKARFIWITNEYELGDFGMGGAFIRKGGYITSTKVFTESILSEYGIEWIKRAGITKIEKGLAHYETLDGEQHTVEFDFSMLIPAFTGVGFKAFDANANDITDKLFASNGFMKVDADYSPKTYDKWSVDDWPSVYQNPDYANIFASGIAFAPPHGISKPMENKNGTKIFPTPPRTGMPSGAIGKSVALNIVESVKKGKIQTKHKASMGRMGAACIVSAGYGLRRGSAATMTVFPIVPDYNKYPEWGRDINYTVGEPGLAGHWIKLLLHFVFLYKAKGRLFWHLIPE